MVLRVYRTETAEILKRILFQIKPLSGPVEGGTLITIEGSNLGLKEEDVRNKIRIGESSCALVEYQVSVKIVCRTGPSPIKQTAPIVIGNSAGFTESSVYFSYEVSCVTKNDHVWYKIICVIFLTFV